MIRYKFGVVAIAAMAAVSGCGEDKKAQAPAKPTISIAIGSAAPLTGGIAHLGKDNENGTRLAVEEANAAKIKIDGKDAEAYLAKKIKEGSTGVWGAVPMPPNGTVADDEARTLAKYILTVK